MTSVTDEWIIGSPSNATIVGLHRSKVYMSEYSR